MLAHEKRANWLGWAGCAGIAAGAFAIYARAFRAPFVLDDLAAIADNQSIRRLGSLGRVLSPPAGTGVGGRPLINLSYALNYAFGGGSVAGYHAVNLLIHVLAAWTVYAVVRRTLETPALASRFRAAATPLALAVAALWCWHPLQTNAVTYVSERAEELMGLFYLLTLYCFILYAAPAAEESVRGTVRSTSVARFAHSSEVFAVLSIACCLLGMLTKEVMVTAPVMIFLYDRTFVSGGFRAAWRNRRGYYFALALTWVPLAFAITGLRHRSVGFGQGVSWWAYALTESRVIVRYFVLALWPHPLVFDHGPYVPAAFGQLWPYAVVVVAAVAAVIVALRRAPVLGFLGCWFFIILSTTSSVVPIVGQSMAESRMYLPLAAIVAGAVCGIFFAAKRPQYPVIGCLAKVGREGGATDPTGALDVARVTARKAYEGPSAPPICCFAIMAAFLLVTARRNADYRSALALWSDTVAKAPDNPRAHVNLGNVWLAMPGRLGDAMAQYHIALHLDPYAVEAHTDLGNAWMNEPGHLGDAIGEYEEAARLRPDGADAHNDLGFALLRAPGRLADAKAQFREALRLDPDDASAHDNLGDALMAEPGNADQAETQYREAIRLNPDLAEAHYNLANVLASEPGKLDDAVAQYQAALQLQPNLADAHYNLGNAYLRMPGRIADAAAEYRAALRLKPGYAEAHFNLALALLEMRKDEEGITELRNYLRLRPDDRRAQQLINQALDKY